MGRIFVLGDVHGAYKALKQCMERAEFDYGHDKLIALGDICDGWPDTRICIDELLRVRNLVYILGNHDTWFRDWLKTGSIPDIWYGQGGRQTLESYVGYDIPKSHQTFFDKAVPWHKLGNRLFVHAGIDPTLPLEEQDEDTFLWARELARATLKSIAEGETTPLTSFDEVYIGHTPISSSQPQQGGGVWLMDTGAGWSGVLSMMEINEKKIFTSDPVPGLYAGVKGRTRY